jgi:hypothetical protein
MVPVVVMQPGAEASGCAVLSSELYSAIGFRCLADFPHAAMRPMPAAIKAWATIVGRARISHCPKDSNWTLFHRVNGSQSLRVRVCG